MAFVSLLPILTGLKHGQGHHRPTKTMNAASSAKMTHSTNLKLDTSVYVVTDRKLAGSQGVLYAVERALEGDGCGRRATIVQ